MKILTNNNTTFDLSQIGQGLIQPIHHAVFDHSNKQNGDYYFRLLSMIETFNDAALEFQIGENKLMLPKSWSMILGDRETYDIELVPIHEINTRNFQALTYNPIKGGILPKFLPLKPIDIFAEIDWTLPRLDFHNFLLVPLTAGENPDCVFIINETIQKKIPQLGINLFM